MTYRSYCNAKSWLQTDPASREALEIFLELESTNIVFGLSFSDNCIWTERAPLPTQTRMNEWIYETIKSTLVNTAFIVNISRLSCEVGSVNGFHWIIASVSALGNIFAQCDIWTEKTWSDIISTFLTPRVNMENLFTPRKRPGILCKALCTMKSIKKKKLPS